MRLLLWTGATLGALLVLLIALFLVGVPLPGDFARSPLENLLSKVFRVPTRIEGPLRLRTGLVASAEADALILSDSSIPDGPPLVRATQPRVKIDLAALLRREVKLDEITAERGEIRAIQSADGRSSWDPVFTRSGGKAPFRFAGIGELRIAAIDVSYRGAGGAKPVLFDIKDFDGTLREREPATARGTLSIEGKTLTFDASTASLGELVEGSLKAIPLQGTVESLGALVKMDGAYGLEDAVFKTRFEVTADHAETLLDALGVATHEPGKLAAQGRLRLDAAEASVSELVLRMGASSVSGSARIRWTGVRPFIELDLAAERFDEKPFVTAAGPDRGKTQFEGYVDVLHALVERIDLNAKASVARYVGLTKIAREAMIETHIDDRVLAMRASGEIFGMQTKLSMDYAAREPKRVLTIRLEGGGASTKNLPDAGQLGRLATTVGSLRGEVRGAGVNSRELVASAHVDLDADDVRFVWSHRVERPMEVNLDSARVDIARGRSAQVQVKGKLNGRPCSLRVAGGTMASLFAGERWPLRLDASCRGAKLSSKGHAILKGAMTTGALRFDARVNPIGPFVEPLGLAADTRMALSTRGQILLSEELARLELDHFQLGRSGGAATAMFSLEEKRVPRVKLAFRTLDVTELAALAPAGGGKAPADPLAREVLPAKVRVPDLDAELSADVAQAGSGETLRRVRIDAAPRDGALPPTRFSFDWRGVAVSGEVAADLRSAHPSLDLSVHTQNTDLHAALAHFGYKGPALRAGKIKVSARGAGVKLGELLESATVNATVEQGRLGDVHRFIPGLTGDVEFSATARVAGGQSLGLAARGSAGGMPFDASISTARLTEFAQIKDELPAALRASLGETRIEASGKLSTKGTGAFRASLSGNRLDRLPLTAAKLPDVGPFSAAADVVIAPASIRASDLDVRFGKSRVLGAIGVKRGGARPVYTANLRAPALHVEDLGVHRLPGIGKKAKPAQDAARSEELSEEQRIDQLRGLLQAFDATIALDVAGLYAEGKDYGDLRIESALAGGDLHVELQDTNLRGGTVQADLRLEASRSRPQLRVRIFTQGYEYGPLAEALKPKTPVEGTLDLSLDVTAGALSQPLFADAKGHADLAVYPRGLRMGGADYWGTGLLYFFQRTLDPSTQSKLNCAVARFNLKDSVVVSEAFFADTTRVRIIGDLRMNIETRQLSGRLSPRAKNPQLFSVAPTVAIAGTLEAPRMEAVPATFITAPLRLFAPLNDFANAWLNSANTPAEGSEGCRQAFERAHRAAPKKPVAPSDSGPSPFPS